MCGARSTAREWARAGAALVALAAVVTLLYLVAPPDPVPGVAPVLHRVDTREP